MPVVVWGQLPARFYPDAQTGYPDCICGGRSLRRRISLYVLAIASAASVAVNTPHPSGRLLPAARLGTNSRTRLLNPAPSGVQGRTDQGVDWSNITGPVRAVGGGFISKIYTGLSGFGTTVIETLSSGQQVYYAGETGAGAPVVREGQQVQAGQEIAPGLGTGGIEVGYWNPATGRAEGYVPGVTSGASTPAGQRFQQAISGTGVPNQYSGTSSLAQLWINAGGAPSLANTMAAIAMAESSGQIDATHTNNNGSVDRGLWQINSVHSQYDANQLVTDPLYNAQAAVAIEKTSGLGAWSTYNDQSYTAYLNKPDLIRGYGGTRPGGAPVGTGSQQGQDVSSILGEYKSLRDTPRTAPPGSGNPFQWFAASFTGNWDNLGGSGA